MKTGFFAYGSNIKHSETCVEAAIKLINSRRETKLYSWRDYSASGKLVIHDVTEAIDSADYFCADLTGMSDNVLFELGYALAKDKPLFLLLDTSYVESTNRYKELFFLRGFGYSRYHNSDTIVEKFFDRKTYEEQVGQFADQMGKIEAGEERKALLYLKGQINTEYSRRITEVITNEYNLTRIIDDPSESPIQGFSWYLEQLSNVPAALIEFSANNRDGFATHNAKCSMISGLAYGLNRDLLMVAEEPYDIPVDYRELLVRYNDLNALNSAITPFLTSVRDTAIQFLSNRILRPSSKKQRSNLQSIEFGQYMAENEGDQVSQYYLEVLDLSRLVTNNYNVVVGRKGVGKTATLNSLKVFLEKNIQNHVCVIEPLVVEIEGLLYLIENVSESHEKSYLIESVWKFLIYTQIVKSLYDEIHSRKKHSSSHTVSERNFSSFVEENKNIFLVDLSERLEQELTNIQLLTGKNNISDFRVKVSEVLHTKTIGEIREQLLNFLESERKTRIVVLIDNLDKSWKRGDHINAQSLWILGLLNVTNAVVRDLSRIGNKARKRVDFNLTIFLRSDIFKYIRDNYAEPDKLDYTYLKWSDQEVLFRVIDNRFTALNDDVVRIEEFWRGYIVDSIDGEPIKKYIFNRILPRPRDLIFFFKEAKSMAVLRGHHAIEAEDIRTAYENYSAWAFSTIIVESEVAIGSMRAFLYAIAGMDNIVTKEEILQSATDAKISLRNDDEFEAFIDYLASISIIGRETRANIFEFEFDFDSRDRLKALSKRLGSNRFKIHNSLVMHLGCHILD